MLFGNFGITKTIAQDGAKMLFGNFGITFAKQIVRTPVVNSFGQTKLKPAEQVFDLNKVLTISLFV